MSTTSSRRNTLWVIIGAVVVLISLIFATFMGIGAKNTPGQIALDNGLEVQPTRSNIFTITKPHDTTVVLPEVAVFEDPMCERCKEISEDHGTALLRAVADGKITLSYHVANVLDANSNTGDYSSRVIGALHSIALIDDAQTFVNFHTWIFENQPQMGESLPDADIIEAMRTAGASNQSVNSFAERMSWQDGITNDTAMTTEEIYRLTQGVEVPVVTYDRAPVSVEDKELKDWIKELK